MSHTSTPLLSRYFYTYINNKKGLQTPYVLKNGFNMFLCDKCANKDEEATCLLCERKEGLLHLTENKQYVDLLK